MSIEILENYKAFDRLIGQDLAGWRLEIWHQVRKFFRKGQGKWYENLGFYTTSTIAEYVAKEIPEQRGRKVRIQEVLVLTKDGVSAFYEEGIATLQVEESRRLDPIANKWKESIRTESKELFERYKKEVRKNQIQAV